MNPERLPFSEERLQDALHAMNRVYEGRDLSREDEQLIRDVEMRIGRQKPREHATRVTNKGRAFSYSRMFFNILKDPTWLRLRKRAA